MKINKVLIRCPTYKESLELRKTLIELGIEWVSKFFEGEVTNEEEWKKCWDVNKKNTIYRIKDNILYYGNEDFYFNKYEHMYKSNTVYSVKEFIDKYNK